MKKRLMIMLLIVIIFPVISAVEFSLNPEFSQGETLIAKVSGNFLDNILPENVFFYRGHVRIPIEYDVAKINDDFYIYALLSDKTPGNYSISIKDVEYMKGYEKTDEDIVKNFTISNKTADFSVNPGFIITNKDFSIDVQNLQDKKINISIKDESLSFELKSGEIKKINFDLKEGQQPTLKTVEISSENLKYELPVYLFTNQTTLNDKISFKFEPSEFNIEMSTDSESKRILYLYNDGNMTLENLTIFLSESLVPYTSFSLDEFTELEPDSNVRLELNFVSDSEEKTIDGKITVSQEGVYDYCFITLTFIKDYIPLENETETEIKESKKTCAELNGSICEEGEECDGEEVYAKDDKCCLGSCGTKQQDSSSTKKIIGWAIIVAVILFLLWFLKKKYLGARNTPDLFKIIRAK